MVALGLEGPEGVAVATSRGPRAAFGCQALATQSVAAEGEGREDWVLPVSAAEGFMNNAGWVCSMNQNKPDETHPARAR